MCAANRLNTGVKLQGASINIPENSQLVTDRLTHLSLKLDSCTYVLLICKYESSMLANISPKTMQQYDFHRYTCK